MHVQASNSGSASAAFTSLWGFFHIVTADHKHVYISDDRMLNTGRDDKSRQSIENNYIIMEELFFFIFAAVVKAYGSEGMLPPGFRETYQNPSYTHIIETPALPFSFPNYLIHLSPSIGGWLLQKKAWFWQFVFRVCGGQLFKYVSDFKVLSIEGVFKRHNER